MYITLHYEHIVIKNVCTKLNSFRLNIICKALVICWRNGFQKKSITYYIIQLEAVAESDYTVYIYCYQRYSIEISSIFFLYFHTFMLRFSFYLLLLFYFYISIERECIWIMCTHLSKCHTIKGVRKENKVWKMTIYMLSQMTLQLIIIFVYFMCFLYYLWLVHVLCCVGFLEWKLD